MTAQLDDDSDVEYNDGDEADNVEVPLSSVISTYLGGIQNSLQFEVKESTDEAWKWRLKYLKRMIGGFYR